MIQRQLSREQSYTISRLAAERVELQHKLEEAQGALGAQAELLRAHFGLPDGQVTFQATGDGGWAIVIYPAQEASDAEPADESEAADRSA